MERRVLLEVRLNVLTKEVQLRAVWVELLEVVWFIGGRPVVLLIPLESLASSKGVAVTARPHSSKLDRVEYERIVVVGTIGVR
jgi:hypothetical protein